MLQSKLFYKALKENPKETEAVSHVFLTRAGYIDQLTSGVYTFLPLGFLVLKKIEKIIREEMKAEPACGQEILMPALSPKENWERTGRWSSLDVLFKLRGANEKDYALNPTHEEVVSPLAKKVVFSYKDLPFSLFQIQTKFRNELRVKSGLLRTREFIMKDLYSFHAKEEDLDKYYNKMLKAYERIFKRCGIGKSTLITLASGGSFSKFSHEFQTITDAGEDTILVCKKCGSAINQEIKEEFKTCPSCKSSDFEIKKAIETGNIFKLNTKYSAPFDLKFRDKDGIEKPVLMGCYGIGLGRLMAAVVEINHDSKGIIWPEETAPFKVHLLCLEKESKKSADKIYADLQKSNIEVLYDDREDKTAGEKFAEADLLGIPLRAVVSKKTLKERSVEVKRRDEEKSKLIKTKKLALHCDK